MHDIYSIPLVTLAGESADLSAYKGRAMLLVNVASQCGFTPQYKQLEALYQQYKAQGLVVCGFPCNQFNQQEPGDAGAIHCFIKDKYQVSFPMFAKLHVKGEQQHPLYQYLQQHLQQRIVLPLVPWNFTKILVNEQGAVVKRFLPWGRFYDLKKKIEVYVGR